MVTETSTECWRRVREHKPLVHCITNYVSMDIMANTLLAIGASPAMVLAAEEVVDFADVASALLVNVGTLTPAGLKAMTLAAAAYQKLGKPWVLDPVAAGATCYRMHAVLDLLALKPMLVRGNASEIMAVAGAADAGGRGTDSTAESETALEAAKQLALQQGCIVAVSGKTDLVTNGHRVLRVQNGHPQMQLITATGCTLTAVATAFLAADPADPVLSVAHAMAIYGLSAEACSPGAGPATMRSEMIDWLASEKELDSWHHAVRITEDA